MNLNFLVEMLSSTLATAGESQLVKVLQELHDSNPDAYKDALTGGYSLVKHLRPLVLKSKTKIDDAVISGLMDALVNSAALNGVELDMNK